MEAVDFKFNPVKYGYWPISKFKVLNYMFPIIDDIWFIKINAYEDFGGGLIFWYSAIGMNGAIIDDDRVKIYVGGHTTTKPSTFECQGESRIVYNGLITSDEYAKTLLSHLLGTTKNKSVEKEGAQRLNDNMNLKMWEEFGVVVDREELLEIKTTSPSVEVLELQRILKVTPDGIFGKNTEKELNIKFNKTSIRLSELEALGYSVRKTVPIVDIYWLTKNY